MNKERELIKQLKQLVVERERTIKENKKDMHSFLNQYKEALELEKELLSKAIKYTNDLELLSNCFQRGKGSIESCGRRLIYESRKLQSERK